MNQDAIREVHMSFKINLPDKNYVCDDNNIKKATVDRVGENSKFFGFGICHKMKVELVAAGPEVPNYIDGTITDVDYNITDMRGNLRGYRMIPPMKIKEVEYNPDEKIITLTAYDALYDANNIPASKLNLTFPTTIDSILTECCKLIGVTRYYTSLKDKTIFKKWYQTLDLQGNETIRDILTEVAEVTGTIYKLGTFNGLGFNRLETKPTPEVSLDSDSYVSLTVGKTVGLKKISAIFELDNIESTNSSTNTGYQMIRNNIFLDTSSDSAKILDDMNKDFADVLITPFNCQWRGLCLGNFINVGGYPTFLINDSIIYDGSITEESQWEYQPTDNIENPNPTTLGDKLNSTFAKVDKANQKIELVAGDVAKLKLDVDGINISYDSEKGTASLTVGEITVPNLVNGSYVDTAVAGIDLTGYVKMTDLQGSGSTIINGDNITTGTISADRLSLTGSISWSDLTQGCKNTIAAYGDTVPDYITETEITSTTIVSPTIEGGTITAGTRRDKGHMEMSANGLNYIRRNGSNIIGIGCYDDTYPAITLGCGIDEDGTDQGMILKMDTGLWIGNSGPILNYRTATGILIDFLYDRILIYRNGSQQEL